ncbi:type I polyketide synthase [Williamsia sterculiae]|uniref:Acyl transferase domain-containing protein n=1 Tax=Williamsia sterculiae TaxID=1344003 RepID=A0A1N7H9E3_9NOCA|nr:type I polyketide synthase [Williamsia sterculiae]SIS21288.1 Acyl transferase domain-containing protein [Williamsia sterculiae]
MVDVAIIGIGCRFPGGIVDPDSFWDFVVDKGDAVTEIPDSRWNVDRYYDADPDAPGRMYVRHASFVEDPLSSFDADFFGISRREAAGLDPQQRRLLQVSWDALEDAGVTGSLSRDTVGTFIGGFTNDSAVSKASSHAIDRIDNFSAFSSSQTLLANRIAYALDLRGPSLTVDTACSSSLVTTHLGVRSIVDGECDIALVGGCNVLSQPETFITMCKGHFLSKDGRCKSFDASADGYGRGEGTGIVVLKALDAARRDGDRVYAVIKGSGINQDGRTLAIPVPNPDSQQALAEAVCAQGGVSPAEVGYVEAHGTGTGVGDPLEATALGRAYGTATGRRSRLRVGSVKNNFGHTEAAAGVAGLIKAVCTVRSGRVAPQAYLETPNPDIAFDDLGLHIPLELEDLDGRHAAVNSFGYGGTNAHVLIERAPEPTPAPPAPAERIKIMPVSARSEDSLRELVRSYGAALRSPTSVGAERFAQAVTARRAHHHLRKAFTFDDDADLIESLESFAAGGGVVSERTLVEGIHDPTFVFSGMGPQWWAMGRALLTVPGPFRDGAQTVDDEFRRIAGWSIIDELLREESASRVTRTDIAQPANFLVQVAFADYLAAHGIRPAAIVGHSVGEVSAAYVSGALSLRDACLVALHRSRQQARTAGTGSMLAVGLTPEDAEKQCARFPGEVSIAAVNGAASITLAGTDAAIDKIRVELTGNGVFARQLRVEVPYHSHLMDPILDDLAAALAGMEPRTAGIPLYSTVTGGRIDGREFADPGYWQRNVRDTVRFADAIGAIIGDRFRVFVEVGPHPVLSGNLREALARHEVTGAVVSTLNRDKNAAESARDTVARLYEVGATAVPGDAEALARQHVPWMPLPRYPWSDAEVWHEEPQTLVNRYGDSDRFALLGDRTDSAESQWDVTLAPANLPWLRHHEIAGAVVMPGAGYIDAALSAARQRSKRDQCGVDGLAFVAPLVVGDHDVPTMRVAVEPASRRLSVRARSGGGNLWTQHAFGHLVEMDTGTFSVTIPETRSEDTVFSGDDIYSVMDGLGLNYGPIFRRIRSARVSEDTCVAQLDAAGIAGPDATPKSPHVVHPALTDAVLQCAAVALALNPDADRRHAVAHIPAAVERVRYFGPVPAEPVGIVKVVSLHPLRVDAFLTDDQGEVALALHGVELAPVGAAREPLEAMAPVFYERRWEDLPRLADEQASDAAAVNSPINAIVEIGGTEPDVVAVVSGVYPSALRMRVDGDAGDEQQLEQLRARLAARRSGDGHLRVAVVVGRGSSPTDVTYRLVSLARVVRRAVTDESVDDLVGQGVRVVVLTRRGIMGPGDTRVDLAHSAVVGARRTIANEDAPIQWSLVDTDETVARAVLSDELTRATTAEFDEVRLRGATRSAEQLVGSLPELTAPLREPVQLASPDDPYEVVLPRTRLFRDIALRACERHQPGPREVEVRIDTLGLNYKDAIKILGILNERHLDGTYFGTTPGMEAYGEVTRIGDEVTDIAVGDVIAVSVRGMMRRYATIDLDGGGAWASVSRSALDDSGASFDPLCIGSGLPFLTAFYAFRTLINLEAGESVLIHGAAGGMGMAAVQVAASMGATVYATASSAERRAAARELGASHTFDSRSSSFVDEILRQTDGKGVDVVYNSMPGEVIAQNFAVAAEFARVVEIGKADIYFGGSVDLRPFDKNLAFYSIDMDRLLKLRPKRFRGLMREAVEVLAQGTIKPLPYTRFPITDLTGAFESVLRGAHLGRIVVDLRSDAPEVLPQQPPSAPVHSDATYLVTGGYGAFGMATARALAQRGATRIVLVGRSGVTDDTVRNQVEAFAARGVEVLCERADISDPAAVGVLLDAIEEPARPLKGIFHTAGVINDQPLAEITQQGLETVMRPKLGGALALHDATVARNVSLDVFVLYSSISAITGTVPQTAYASANTALDAFAAWRRSQGLAAVSVNWGAMSGGGMAQNSEVVRKYLEYLGFGTIDLDDAVDFFFEASRFGFANPVIAEVNWSTWRTTNTSAALSRRFAQVADAPSESSQVAAARAAILNLPPDERVPAAVTMITEQLSEVLGVPPDKIDTRGPIADLGIDSVMGVELGTRIQKQLDVPVSMFQFTGDLTIDAIGARAVKMLTQDGNDE